MRGLTSEAIEILSETAIQKSLRRIDFPDMPRQRMAFRLEQAGLRDEGERYAALGKALRQLDSLRLRTLTTESAGLPTGGVVSPFATGIAPPPPAAGLAPRRWNSIGPGHIGGRTRAILPHPTEHKKIWLGSAGGGVWLTEDAGASWFPVDDFMGNLAITTLVMDPNDPNVIYAGSGEGFGNLDSLRGAGIFRTTNGTDWAQIAATDRPEFRRINRLALSEDGAVLLAATNSGIFRSEDADRTRWDRVLTTAVADVKCHPSDSKKAVAGGLDSGQAWRTKDGGKTWDVATHTGSWSSRVEVCYATADPNTVYASVDVSNGEIWRSRTGGRTFSKRKSRNPNNRPANYLGDQGWYDNVIWAGDPTDRDFVIVGGIDLWRSTDGGNQLVDISTWQSKNSAHADHHAIVSHPSYNGTNKRTVYFGNDGGIYRAKDAKSVGSDPTPRDKGWENLNNSYGVTQFYGGAVNPATGVIVCGAQDNGTLAYHPNSGQWRSIFGGDGGFCAADMTDPDIFYGEYVRLNVFRNTDGATTDDTHGDRYISGQFWNSALRIWDWKAPPFRIPDAFNQRALFIAPFVLDPGNADRILAGGESLWRTNDAKTANTPTSGPSWHRIKAPANGMISAIAIDNNNSDHVWVGQTSGELFRSDNATDTNPIWLRIDQQGLQPVDVNRYVHQISISPHSSDRILVTYGDYKSGNVWLSETQGRTWSNIGSGLPEAPVRAATYHPVETDWIYIGTEVGVFGSEDVGRSWSPVNEGPANVSVDDLIWNGATLICITHGRGVFTIDLNTPVPPTNLA